MVNIKRLVVKVGTSTLTHDTGKLNFRSFDRLASVLSDIKNRGVEVILVSSGAIAVGVEKLRMGGRPAELRLKQAAAAVGQSELMHLYGKSFGEYGVTVGQILLTRDDVERPAVRQNLTNTFAALLELGALPVVNENDSVSFEEIESNSIFGDNDTLSALVAELVGADLLVLLSDIDGLYDRDPKKDSGAVLIREITEITNQLHALAGGAGSGRGTGGMITKLLAAQHAMSHGIGMIITNGARPEQLYSVLEGEHVGTYFAPE